MNMSMDRKWSDWSKVHKAHFNLVGINHKQLVNLCENLLNSTEIVQEKF